MALNSIIYQMLSLFSIVAVGFTANKLKVLTAEGNKILAKLVINVAMSAMIIASVLTVEKSLNSKDIIILLAAGFLTYIVFIPIAYLTPRILRAPKDKYGLYSFMAIFGSVGYMGFPVLASICGNNAVFYAALFTIPFDLLVFSVGVLLIAPGESVQIKRDILLSPPFLASVLALILYFVPFSLPNMLVEATTLLGDMTTPGAMLVIGASLAEISWREVFGNWRLYFLAAAKLLLCPLLIFICFRWFIHNPLIMAVAVITSAMPIATNTTMICMEHNGDEALASKGIFISTIMSIFTIPFIITILM
ncbi:MAG: AEC family transporter [Bacillota bacterium]|nr:AEC family transporter [Bacillota bacterium]